MTVIAALVTPEGAWMGGDSLSHMSNVVFECAEPKVQRMGERLIGTAGDWQEIDRLLQVFETHRDVSLRTIRAEIPHSENVCALVIEHGRIFMFDGGGLRTIPIVNGISYSAIGSGAELALGALHATQLGLDVGLTKIRKALSAAVEHDPFCGGPLVILDASC